MVEWHPPELVQPEPAARRAVLVMIFLSLTRRSSLRTNMSWALANVGRIAELAMSSAVLEKRGLRPRRRARTSCESSTGWPTSRRAVALIFRRWQYAEMVESSCTMEWNSLKRKMARGSLLVWKIPSMATHRSRAVVVDGAGELAANAALRDVPLGFIGLLRSRAVDVRSKAEFAAQ